MFSQKTLLVSAGSALIILTLNACQPGPLVKKEPAPADIDSVLFFEQKTISDPFLDSLSQEYDRGIHLKTLLLPPQAPPPPDYREIDGFRIQAFAGLDSLNAYRIKTDLRSAIDDPVYLVKESGLFKVQIGDFPYRVDADNRNMKLRREGYSNAWVVSRKIRIPREDIDEPAESTADSVQAETKEDISPGAAIPFRIQILATSDEARAMQLTNDLKRQFSQPAWYEKSSGLFKVYLGKFSERDEADSVLKSVRAGGYPDAWLVY
jgi:hypothetical protein